MISLQLVDDYLQESRWKNLSRGKEDATACVVTTKISGVIYMTIICVGRAEFFGCILVLSLEVAQCGQEGRQTEWEEKRQRIHLT